MLPYFRYIREGLAALADQAPTLEDALSKAAKKASLVLDGTLVRTDRVRMTTRGADAPFYSGKVHHHDLNV